MVGRESIQTDPRNLSIKHKHCELALNMINQPHAWAAHGIGSPVVHTIMTLVSSLQAGWATLTQSTSTKSFFIFLFLFYFYYFFNPLL